MLGLFQVAVVVGKAAISLNRALGDLKAELQQLPMDARRSPDRIGPPWFGPTCESPDLLSDVLALWTGTISASSV
jgi:hypothetical protein